MEYNSQRPRLAISEHGRIVQKMIDNACAIEDNERRNAAAKDIIAVLTQLNPQLRDQSDFKHKLWDYLFIASNFKLEVDSPFPKPTAEALRVKPENLSYPATSMRYRHYGKIVEKMIDNAKKIEDPALKESMTSAIAHHLKKSFLAWNRDSVADETIFKDLKELSEGALGLPEGTQLGAATEVLSANYSQNQGKKFNKNKQKPNKFKRKFGSSNSY
jgi:hypothetical protein